MNRIILTILLITASFVAFAISFSDSTEFREVNAPVSLSYQGDYLGTKPGFNLCFENTLRITSVNKRNDKVVLRTLYNQYNFGGYNHKNYNGALFLNTGIGLRKTRVSGFFTGYGINLGVIRTFTPGPTYVVDDNNNISETVGGYFYGTSQLSYEMGRKFSIQEIPFGSFIQLIGMAQFPYNNGALFHIMAGFGFRYEIGWTKNVRVINK